MKALVLLKKIKNCSNLLLDYLLKPSKVDGIGLGFSIAEGGVSEKVRI